MLNKSIPIGLWVSLWLLILCPFCGADFSFFKAPEQAPSPSPSTSTSTLTVGTGFVQDIEVKISSSSQQYKVLLKRIDEEQWRIAAVSAMGLKLLDVTVSQDGEEAQHHINPWIARLKFPYWKMLTTMTLSAHGDGIKNGDVIFVGRRKESWQCLIQRQSKEGWPLDIIWTSQHGDHVSVKTLKVKQN